PRGASHERAKQARVPPFIACCAACTSHELWRGTMPLELTTEPHEACDARCLEMRRVRQIAVDATECNRCIVHVRASSSDWTRVHPAHLGRVLDVQRLDRSIAVDPKERV